MRAKRSRRMALLAVVSLISIVLFLFYGITGSWAFVLEERSIKLSAIIIAGASVAVSTVIFQTLTRNRILTPGIMGLDSLYLLFQTLIVFFIGSAHPLMTDKRLNFLITLLLLIGFSFFLYYFLFKRQQTSIYFILLVGIVFGTLFQSGSSFMQMLIDPNEFLIVQGKMFASFNAVNAPVLGMAALVFLLALIYLLPFRKDLDALILGRDLAINLGVPYYRLARHVLIIISMLVAVSTALVGPVTFLGLIVANLSYQLFDTYRHSTLIPGAALISIIALVFGQWIVERILTFSTTLSVIINFIGGIYFIYLLIKENHR